MDKLNKVNKYNESNKRETGKKYEEEAAQYLQKNGFVLLTRNFRCRQGEVDLIGVHDNCLVFVEVKYRKSVAAGAPEEAVNPAKQRKICLVSDYYRIRYPSKSDRQIRYDVVTICGEKVSWYQNAFPYCVRRKNFSW
ncbi:YraN family protein [Parablautia intestinalis]|uniref:YraN family protein n=1 Tax=Parablautia intestinalis TaxID=2320100 RepID=UPI002412A444|nr:YraN family protein [Parablautia intestinalis]